MGHVFQRQLDTELPVAVAGEGVYLIDESGKRYLDASAGAAVSALGHSDTEVRRAIIEQVESLAFAHTSFFTTRVAEELADHLAQAAPAGLERVYFVSGGSEAMEAALKLSRQYFVEQGQPQRRHFIARRQSYHGNTLGALAVSGHPARRAVYAPLLIETTHIS
ncbi:MAG: aminotransferase class III-fold pyridoxal phosphate-dependent enzyme, partial [Alphaproteobacteria bacterium]|nr:aminotransferase class III-fold pyridoxal phosphate-dependent enzyme [Alphaproteobacteria bacterium]